jgi:N-acetyl-anhydromuramoyl-L-alanine amidase
VSVANVATDEQRCGWLAGARVTPSPNFDQRPAGALIDLVVIHAISLPPGQFGGPYIEQLFTNRLDVKAHPYFATIDGLRVSAHFLIHRDGLLRQFVDVFARAWHAGDSMWRGRTRCNDFSIGIELEGCDERPFTSTQYASLAQLLEKLFAMMPALSSDSLVGHSDIAPARKTDPGPCFDWCHLRQLLSR